MNIDVRIPMIQQEHDPIHHAIQGSPPLPDYLDPSRTEPKIHAPVFRRNFNATKLPPVKGFTQLELVVTLGIASLIILAVGMWQVDIFRFNTALSGQLTSQHEARQTILTMVHELRTVVTADTGAYPLETVQDAQITFFSNIDDAPDIERVHYFIQNGALKRGIIKPSGNPVAYTGTETVTNLATSLVNGATPVFSYYNSSYAGTGSPLAMPADPNVIRYIGITLVIDKDITRPPAAIRVMGGVNLRNLKDNL